MRLSFEAVEHMVAGETEYPGTNAENVCQVLPVHPDLDEDILYYIFCNNGRICEVEGEGIDEIPVLVKQLPEGSLIALCDQLKQFSILVMGVQVTCRGSDGALKVTKS